MNLQEKINHNQNCREFSETEAINLKKVASFFQDAIHFHPGHLQPTTLIFSISAVVESFDTKVDPYFWIFTGMSTSFGYFKNTKNGDRASLRRHSEIFCFVPNGVNFFSKAAQNCVF